MKFSHPISAVGCEKQERDPTPSVKMEIPAPLKELLGKTQALYRDDVENAMAKLLEVEDFDHAFVNKQEFISAINMQNTPEVYFFPQKTLDHVDDKAFFAMSLDTRVHQKKDNKRKRLEDSDGEDLSGNDEQKFEMPRYLKFSDRHVQRLTEFYDFMATLKDNGSLKSMKKQKK
jgi:hypothetical protein